METLLYCLCRLLIAGASCVPMRCLGWFGRQAGTVAWWLDARHRNVALENLAAAFPEKNESEIQQIAREHFQRLGETYASILKTGGMDAEGIRRIVTFKGCEKIEGIYAADPDARVVLAIGHFGNFELFLWIKLALPSGQNWLTTYRALRQPKLTELMLKLREPSGAQLFERNQDADALKAAMSQPALMLGLLADQHAGAGGLRLPVFGRTASMSPAPAVMAKRYKCRLFHAPCFRTGPGQWSIEVDDEIPLRENGKLRSSEAITRDIITAQEAAIRRDPANWFWVHNRWKIGNQ